MKIIHLTHLSNDKASGVSNIVPLHIKNQSLIVDTCWINISKGYIPPENCESFYVYIKTFDKETLESLPKKFRKPDLVVFHELYYYQFVNIGKILETLNIPYIIVPHGCLTLTSRKKKYLKKLIGLNFFFSMFLKKSLAIQYLTEGEKKESINKWNNKSIVVPNGCNKPSLSKKDFNKNEIIGTFIGRKDIHIKGLDLLLAACKEVKKTPVYNNLTINIYGKEVNNSNNKLKLLLKKYRVEKTVNICDGVFGVEKEEVLLKSDFFILPSRSEGHPVALIEAMSYGLPSLITSNTNMGKEVINYDAGWVAETNAKSIAQELIKILNNTNQFKRKSINAKSLSEIYDWKKVAISSVEKYSILIKKNKEI